MYSEITMEGFRGLGRLRLPLSRVTVLTGKNGIGKTAVLEAIFLHACGVHAPGNAVQVLRPMRDLPPLTRSESGEVNNPWAQYFTMGDVRTPLTLEAVVDGATWRLTLEQRSTAVRSLSVNAAGTTSSTGAGLHVTLTGSLLDAPVEHHVVALLEAGGQSYDLRIDPAPTLGVIQPARIVKGVGAVNVLDAYTGLRLHGDDTALLASLRAMDPRITGLELLAAEGATRLHARFATGEILPFPWLGSGINRALTYLLAASDAEGGVLLVDEIEDGLHHSVLEPVWRHLIAATRATGTQLVVTTHSDEAIRAVAAAMEDDIEDLSLVRLRDARSDEHRWGSLEPGGPVSPVVYRGHRVADAVSVAAEVR